MSSAPQPTIEELSQQIGLVDSHSPTLPLAGDTSANAPPDSLDAYLEEADSPEHFTTKPAFYNTGVSKAALVGGVGLVLFLGGASIFKVASPGGKAETVADADLEEAPEDPTLVALRQSKAAESKARAKLALLAQNKVVDSPQVEASTDAEPTAEVEDTPDSKKSEAAVKPLTQAPPAPPPPKPYSTVTPKPTLRPTPPPAPTATPPVFSHARSLNPAPILPVNQPVNQPDPLAELQRLASLGTYGEVDLSESDSRLGGADANARVAALFPEATGLEAGVIQVASSDPETAFGVASTAAPLSDYFERSASVALTKAAETKTPKLASAGSDGITSTVAAAIPALARPVPEPAVPATPVIEDPKFPPLAQSLTQPPERTILVGSSGQGQLMTPVIWAPDGARGAARFIVSLNQPILDSQGQVALPPDTQFVVAAQNLDPDSGLVDLTVMALVIDGQEYEAPEGIFSVRDRQGGLLLGKLRNPPNQGRGDTARVLTGALAQVGRLMNRPSSTRTSRSNGSFGSSESSATQNNDPNYVGAVLEGGFEEFASVMEERQQAAAEALAKAPQLYQLPAGHPIQIFINQSLSL